jgi:hypothetical protein
MSSLRIYKTMLGREIGHLGGTLGGAHGAVHGIDSINGEWAGVMFITFHRGGHPSMGLKDMVDVGCAGESDTITMLVHNQTVEVMEEAKVFEGQLQFGGQLLELHANLAIDGAGNFFIGICHGKVIHLAKEKDGLATNDLSLQYWCGYPQEPSIRDYESMKQPQQ